MLNHDICRVTSYCKRCGSHADTIIVSGLECLSADATNVIAISHLRSMDIAMEFEAMAAEVGDVSR